MEMSPRFRTTPSSSFLSVAAAALGDDAIWKRLRDAGFDEETVRRRDKAALISYITKLESEVYDYQHHMGLLILEKKEWTSKFEHLKASSELATNAFKREQASQLSALAETKKQGENLKKALGIEKECLANIEKALHDMRAESAEGKLEYESKLAEAQSTMETAAKKLLEAEGKFREAESLHVEAGRSRDSAARSLKDIEAREDELRRQNTCFKSECNAKENELFLQKQSLFESQQICHEEEGRFLERQVMLDQREEYILGRFKELSVLEKKLDGTKKKLEEDCGTLKEDRSNFDLNMSALAAREGVLIQRESLLDKRERELLILQERIANKEFDEIQKRTEEHQHVLEKREKEFEAELELRRRSFEDVMNAKLTKLEDKEAEVNQKEKMITERENTLHVQRNVLVQKQDELTKNLKLLCDKEQCLKSAQSDIEMKNLALSKERELITSMKSNMEKLKLSLDDEKKGILESQKNLELTMSERNELIVLRTKLKEEIDSFREQKMKLEDEADRLKAEKEKFEAEWELIDEKRAALKNEAEWISSEREAVSRYLKNEHDNIKQEKESLRNHLKTELDCLSREREEFMLKMEHEHLDLFNNIQRERADFMKDIEIQKRDLENCIDKRREEAEIILKQKEEIFEQEREKELHYISSQKEMSAKELEHIAFERKRLSDEKLEIVVDREQREKEWYEIKSSIEMLNIQREKLQKQKELLHADREEMNRKIEHLKNLEGLDLELESRALSEKQNHHTSFVNCKIPANGFKNSDEKDVLLKDTSPMLFQEKGLNIVSPPKSAAFSWIRRCANIIKNTDKSCPPKDDPFEDKNGQNSGYMHNDLESSHLRKKRKWQKDILSRQGTIFSLPWTKSPCVEDDSCPTSSAQPLESIATPNVRNASLLCNSHQHRLMKSNSNVPIQDEELTKNYKGPGAEASAFSMFTMQDECDGDSEDENHENGGMSVKQKLWIFLTT